MIMIIMITIISVIELLSPAECEVWCVVARGGTGRGDLGPLPPSAADWPPGCRFRPGGRRASRCSGVSELKRNSLD